MKIKQSGFSLIELAVVLFILSLLLGGMLSPLATSIEQENRQKAQDDLNEIKDLLLGYAIINGRLPCPDCPDLTVGSCNAAGSSNVNDGLEDRYDSGGIQVCRTDIGNLPWTELQIKSDDAWGNYYTYQVTPDFSRESNNSACGSATTGISFELCTSGDIDIYDTYATTYPVTPTVANDVVAIVISHGKNFLETSQQDQEVENYGRNPENPDSGTTIISSYTPSDYVSNVFIYTDYTNTSSGDVAYDDLMIWLPAPTLMNKMVSAGKLP